MSYFYPVPAAESKGRVKIVCGRYASGAQVDELVEEFDVVETVPGLPGPSWNVAPTHVVRAVVDRPAVGRSLVPVRWGLVPSWAKEPGIGARMINARLETVAEKPSFRSALRARRCLVPADGYYEWQKLEGRKQPWFIRRSDDRMLAMAGLWETWIDHSRPPDHPDRVLVSMTIITTAATDELGRIHDRMPVAVPTRNWDAWLDPGLGDAEEVLGLVGAPPAMTSHRVAADVGRVARNHPGLVEPLPTG